MVVGSCGDGSPGVGSAAGGQDQPGSGGRAASGQGQQRIHRPIRMRKGLYLQKNAQEGGSFLQRPYSRHMCDSVWGE